MDSSTDEDLRSIVKSLNTLQQISSAGLSLGSALPLTRPLQRKLETLIKCNIHDAEGRSVAMRSALSVADRVVCDLIVLLQAQQQQQEKLSLWTAIRSHGCQFLGPAMQEEVLKLVLLALEDGSSLSRKVLVLFVVQRLHLQFPQASKTSVGHVVQLLYRASCFNVMKRDEESSLMQLKEEFRNYEKLRCQHDMQIVEISRDFGLRIGPEQWSCLLYGDNSHRKYMQSIVDKVSKRQTLLRSSEELLAILQKSGDPLNLSVELQPLLNLLVDFQKNISSRSSTVSLPQLDSCVKAVVKVISLLSRSLWFNQTRDLDCSPTLVNHQFKTGGESNGDIKATDDAALDLFVSPTESSSKCCQVLQSESSSGSEIRFSPAFHSMAACFPNNPSTADEVSKVTTAMSSCGLSCMKASSSVIAEDGSYRLLSTGYPCGITLPPHYSMCESLSFHTSSQPPFFSPPLNVVTAERVCTPVTGGFCPSPVLVSVHNLPGPSECFQPVWYPTPNDYNHVPSASNHLS